QSPRPSHRRVEAAHGPLSNATAPTPRSFTRSCDDDVLGHHALLLADSAAVKEARLTPPFYPISENRISGRTIVTPRRGENDHDNDRCTDSRATPFLRRGHKEGRKTPSRYKINRIRRTVPTIPSPPRAPH